MNRRAKIPLLYDDFFFCHKVAMPSSGKLLYNSVVYKLFLQVRAKKFSYNDSGAIVKSDRDNAVT